MKKINRIRIVLAEKEMTIVELAQRIGRHRTAVSEYARNQRQPPLEVLYKIAEALDCEVSDLLEKK